jgi:hypothetical protein
MRLAITGLIRHLGENLRCVAATLVFPDQRAFNHAVRAQLTASRNCGAARRYVTARSVQYPPLPPLPPPPIPPPLPPSPAALVALPVEGPGPCGVQPDTASAAAARTSTAANAVFIFNFPAKQTTADQDQLGTEPEKDGSRPYLRRSRLRRDIKSPFNAKDARQDGLFLKPAIN